MKLIIDIRDDVYNDIKNGYFNHNLTSMGYSIKNGIPLPKGHGRLIDADKTLKRHCTEFCRYRPSCEEDCVIYDLFHLAKTVIEADMERSE